MVLDLKSGPQIAEKTGSPAGLLLRKIWYSVWKSGVLGITEYRQGRPLECIAFLLLPAQLNTYNTLYRFSMPPQRTATYNMSAMN